MTRTLLINRTVKFIDHFRNEWEVNGCVNTEWCTIEVNLDMTPACKHVTIIRYPYLQTAISDAFGIKCKITDHGPHHIQFECDNEDDYVTLMVLIG